MADPRPLHQEPRHHPFSVGQADAGVLRLRQALARRVQPHHHPGEQRRRRELGQPASGGGGADRPGRGALADPAAEPPAQWPAGDRVRPRRLPLLPHRPPFGSVDLVQRRRGRHLERAPPHHHPRHRAGPGGGAAGRGADHHHRGGAEGQLAAGDAGQPLPRRRPDLGSAERGGQGPRPRLQRGRGGGALQRRAGLRDAGGEPQWLSLLRRLLLRPGPHLERRAAAAVLRRPALRQGAARRPRAGDLPQPGRQPRHPCLGRRPDRYLVPSRRRALRRRGAARRGRPAHRQPSARRHPLPAAAAGEPAQRHPAGGAAAGGRAARRAAGHAAREPGVVPRAACCATPSGATSGAVRRAAPTPASTAPPAARGWTRRIRWT